jgi:hypothetical protein
MSATAANLAQRLRVEQINDSLIVREGESVDPGILLTAVAGL